MPQTGSLAIVTLLLDCRDRVLLVLDRLLDRVDPDLRLVVLDGDASGRYIDAHQAHSGERLQSAFDRALAVLAGDIGDAQDVPGHGLPPWLLDANDEVRRDHAIVGALELAPDLVEPRGRERVVDREHA